MARLVQVRLGSELVQGEELEFETVSEGWNEYSCSDGTRVRAKLVASKIIRIQGRTTPNGDPLYVMGSSTVIAATSPGGDATSSSTDTPTPKRGD